MANRTNQAKLKEYSKREITLSVMQCRTILDASNILLQEPGVKDKKLLVYVATNKRTLVNIVEAFQEAVKASISEDEGFDKYNKNMLIRQNPRADEELKNESQKYFRKLSSEDKEKYEKLTQKSNTEIEEMLKATQECDLYCFDIEDIPEKLIDPLFEILNL